RCRGCQSDKEVDHVGEVVGAVLLLVGTIFCVLGVYGLLRLPDLYNRLHAGGKVATFGAGGVLLSLLFLAPPQAGIKGLATALFLLLTAPLVTHIMARAAHRLRIPLADESVRDDLAEDRRVGTR
ncbi:MAG: monovalent cation/H(+) antiporter subunit G, partial [Gemmatimonadales bacterium]